MSDPQEGRRRVVIENIRPQIDGGRFPIKRTIGEAVVVEADVFADGHDLLVAALLYRPPGQTEWRAVSMEHLGNDRYRAQFVVQQLGRWQYTVRGWIDRFHTWRHDLVKRAAAHQDLTIDLLIGAALVRQAAARAADSPLDSSQLQLRAEQLAASHRDQRQRYEEAVDPHLLELMDRWPDLRLATTHAPALEVIVDRQRARFSAWYEMFPRSTSPYLGAHGTLRDCIARLPYVAEMGFDILYLPPIHPIGQSFRKGRNNAVTAQPGDVGSPWAIGAESGGHKAIHPELGTLEDFRALVTAAAEHQMEIALDIAFQCSPDHPYVRQHPEWFRKRPDGSIQYAENPPKKYQDIYPFDFETDCWRSLWNELKSVFEFWIEQGVNIFRVDNPHTKPFAFWEWCLGELQRDHPETIFLSEAFTRPKVMYRLAKLGFTQSYTYFAWRNTKQELTEYFIELTQTDVREVFRPNLWPNTPDILNEYLQTGGRPAFMTRLVLAATLGASYGIYGPAFELCLNQPREPGSEEYRDSEKYEIKHWALDRPESLRGLIGRVNRIRRQNPALQSDTSLRFHAIDNERLLCFSKQTADRSNTVLVVVNLDPFHKHWGMLEAPLERIGVEPERPFQVHDMLSNQRFLWQGPRAYVELDPNQIPAHIFRVHRELRTEQDFETYERIEP
jgi:starch synthase (maltosyl-transferring)